MKNIMIFAIFFCFLSGCQFIPLFSPIVTGIIIWKDGQAHKYYNMNSDIMFRTVKSSLKDLDFTIKKSYKKNSTHYLQAENYDKMYIEISTVRKNITQVSIRINTFGNKSHTELFYHKIDENLDVINYDSLGSPVKYLN